MPRSLLPPRGIFTATRVVFDARLSPSVKETLLQLMALSWGSPSHHTPPLSYAQLEAITGKNSRTLRGHLQALRNYQAALRLQPAGAGQFIVALAPWLFTDREPLLPAAAEAASGSFLPQPVKEEEEDIFEIGEDFLLLPEIDSDHSGGDFPPTTARMDKARAQKDGAGTVRPAPAAGSRPLSETLRQQLRALGVFPGLLDEVARRAAEWRYSERELTALAEWCRDDQPERPAGLFIGRLRAGARAPALYDTPPCRICGQRGGHASDCRARYATGF